MANSISLAQKFLPLLDEVYGSSALTSILDNQMVEFSGGNTVKVFKMSLDGLGDYNRNSGFVKGDVTGSWESLALTQDRGRSFLVDSMDDEETLNQSFGKLSSEFIRSKVAPEIDAYRFAAYAGKSGIGSTYSATALSSSTVISAIDTGVEALDDGEVPMDNRILFIAPSVYKVLKQSNASNRLSLINDTKLNRNITMFDDMQIVVVPQNRFVTKINLLDGATSGESGGGYEKDSTNGKDINFMIVHKDSVLQIAKHTMPRIFDPLTNQEADAWKFDYRIYHDAFVYDNKVKGIYLHYKTTASS